MWKSGAVVRLIVSVCSIILSKLSLMIAAIARSAFLAMSTGAWLTLVAWYVYGVPRRAATQASGVVVLTNSSGGRWDFLPGDITISNDKGFTYRNTTAFSLEATASATASFAADVTGTGSNSGVGTITTLVTTLTGVTVTNPVDFIGLDEESDGALITRCLLKPESLSPNGPRGAYQLFAMNAVRGDGTAIGVNRVTVSPYSTTGRVTVVVASPTGSISGTWDDPDTDLGAIFANEVANALPEAVTLTVQTAETVPLNVTFWTYYPANVIVTAAQQIIVGTRALEAWLPTVPIGGITIDGVCSNAILRDTLRDIISDQFVTDGYGRPLLVRIITPSTDVSLGSLQVAEPATILAQAA
jgi:hypothetical protein